nr:hypothetical protein [Paenibacillus alginolyticus]
MFGGGIPLSFEGRIVGAVGASGSTVATYPKARIGSSDRLL